MMWGYNYSYPMMGYGGYGEFWWLHAALSLIWIIVLVVLIATGVRWLREGKPPGHSRHGGESAVDILKERYARGEISKEEFEEKKRDIRA